MMIQQKKNPSAFHTTGSFLFSVVFFGMKLAKIVLIAIALTVANFALMFHFGFIHWA